MSEQTLVERLRKHLRQLPAHVMEREQSRLLLEAATALESLARAEAEMKERCAKAIPDTWLDPLLTGKDRVIGNAPDCPMIVRLLNALATRIRALPLREGGG